MTGYRLELSGTFQIYWEVFQGSENTPRKKYIPLAIAHLWQVTMYIVSLLNVTFDIYADKMMKKQKT